MLGCAIAARLAATRASVCLLEAAGDVAEGASKGNAGIAVSYYGGPGMLDTELIGRANPGWEALCARLDVPYRRIGALILALDDAEASKLDEVAAEARACGARAALLDGDRARALEPLVAPACRTALHLPDEGIVDPMRLTVAFARLAAVNGCDVRRGARVTALARQDGGRTRVVTRDGVLRARFVVNAAGASAGAVSALAGGEPYAVWPRKGQYVLLDREFGRRMRSIVFRDAPGRHEGRQRRADHARHLPARPDGRRPRRRARRRDRRGPRSPPCARARRASSPRAPAAAPIKVFAANRPASDERLRLRLDSRVDWLLHATNRSTGVSIAPAAAERALALLREAGLDAPDRDGAVLALPAVPRLRTARDPERLTALDPGYGQVVCACEQVSAAELAAALRGPVGARSVDAVRKRTGATYGRCQGAMCLAGVTFLCAMAAGDGPAGARLTAAGSVGA